MTFLIARPFDKAVRTQALFKAKGYQASILPLINIEPIHSKFNLEILNKAVPHIIIITSSYASEWLNQQVAQQALTFDMERVTIACVGASTAKCLSDTIRPKRLLSATPENSEGLLALPCFEQVERKSIALLKGKSGRELIIDTLTKNKAELAVIDVYQRTINEHAIQSFTFEQSSIQCMIATSAEIVAVLIKYVDKSYLSNLQWIVASDRIKDYALRHGIRNIEVSHGASDEALLQSAQRLVNTGAVND